MWASCLTNRESMIEEFIQHKRRTSEGLSSVATPYYYQLKHFGEFLAEEGYDLHNFTTDLVEEYMRVLKPSVSDVFLAAVREYCKYRTSRVSDEHYLKESRRYHDLTMIKGRKKGRKVEKKGLTQEELMHFFDFIEDDRLFTAATLSFYYGWRPSEGTLHFSNARFFDRDRYMVILTSKTLDERILPWAEKMGPYIKKWRSAVKDINGLAAPQKWFTGRLKSIDNKMKKKGVIPNDMKITAKTARNTFKTQMRIAKIEEWKAMFIMGHTVKIPDIYTDWTDPQLLEDLREPMEDKHYLLKILN